MNCINVKFVKMNSQAIIPTKAYPDDAGFDLFATVEQTILPGEYKKIPIGLGLQLPPWTEAQIRPRSGLAAKFGITVLNTPGTVDAGYRGEIQVVLINHGKNPFEVNIGMRIAQMVIQPVYPVDLIEVENLDDTPRGTGGFGSTNI